jgi:hypothetical protein
MICFAGRRLAVLATPPLIFTWSANGHSFAYLTWEEFSTSLRIQARIQKNVCHPGKLAGNLASLSTFGEYTLCSVLLVTKTGMNLHQIRLKMCGSIGFFSS